MSEWLTTGQMIDALKVGEIAETNEQADFVYRVKKAESGSIMYLDDKGELSRFLVIRDSIAKLKWRILPKYVSFEEAMKALKEGKFVHFHKNINTTLSMIKWDSMNWFSDCMWEELLDGTFYIEGDY